jgi:uncharacterized protein (TIGR02328 family)
MRLWHIDLIPLLPRQQLLGQHRECCALRGGGWGKPHEIVNYVFQYNPYKLVMYHNEIMLEMEKRGYNVSTEWKNPTYRGLKTPPWEEADLELFEDALYPEHNEAYLKECVENLRQKGIELPMTDANF